jgi:hypothetical protein
VIVGPNKVSMVNEISFATTNTLRNETVDIGSIDANYVVSIDGVINENKPVTGTSATVVLVGGNDTFVHEKQPREPMFYMTVRQKLTIYAILKALATRTDTASVSASVPILDTIVKATYTNFRG